MPDLVRAVLRDELDPTDLPPLLWDLWANGFHTGAQKMRHRVASAEHDANRWAYIALNPEDARERHAKTIRETLAAIDTAKGEATYQRDRALLDQLEAEDPIEYRRLAWLRMTDRAQFNSAIEAHRREEVQRAS